MTLVMFLALSAQQVAYFEKKTKGYKMVIHNFLRLNDSNWGNHVHYFSASFICLAKRHLLCSLVVFKKTLD
jgi:hypothetical protein